MKQVILQKQYEQVCVVVDGETVATLRPEVKVRPADAHNPERTYAEVVIDRTGCPQEPPRTCFDVNPQDIRSLCFDAVDPESPDAVETWRRRVLSQLRVIFDRNIPTQVSYIEQHRREEVLRSSAQAFGGHFPAFLEILLSWLEHVELGAPTPRFEAAPPDIAPAGVPGR